MEVERLAVELLGAPCVSTRAGGERKPFEGRCGGAAVAELGRQREAVAAERGRAVEVVEIVREHARAEQRARPNDGRRVSGRLERALEPAATLGGVAAQQPEAPERRGEQQCGRAVVPHELAQRAPEVVVLAVEAHQRARGAARRELRLELDRQPDVQQGVHLSRLVLLPALLEPLQRELAHRLEQRQPRPLARLVRSPDEALVDERLQVVEHRARRHHPPSELLGRRKSAASCADRHALEEPLLVGLEEVVAPRQRVAHGALSRRQIRRPADEEVERRAQPLEQRLRREQPHSGGGELDRQREAVELLADGGDRGLVPGGEREARRHDAGPVGEQPHGSVQCERRHGELVLALQVQGLAARDEDPRPDRALRQPADERGRRDHVLEAVE